MPNWKWHMYSSSFCVDFQCRRYFQKQRLFWSEKRRPNKDLFSWAYGYELKAAFKFLLSEEKSSKTSGTDGNRFPEMINSERIRTLFRWKVHIATTSRIIQFSIWCESSLLRLFQHISIWTYKLLVFERRENVERMYRIHARGWTKTEISYNMSEWNY